MNKKVALIRVLVSLGIVGLVFLAGRGGSTVTGVTASPWSGPHGWQSIGPSPPGVWAPVMVDPNGSGTIYIASVGGGVRKSTDNGVTWSNAGLDNLGVFGFSMDAAGPDHVYAGVFSADDTIGSGVYKSDDGGVTWSKVLDGIPWVMTGDPNIPGTVYAGLLGGLLKKSIDGGATWQTIYTDNQPISSVKIDPSDSNTIYASTLGNDAVKSTDGGGTWTRMTGLTPRVVWGLAIDPTYPTTLYATTNDDGVWRSDDSGATWAAVGAPGGVPFFILVDPSPAHTVYATTTTGIWQTCDGGTTWAPTGLADRMTISITMGPDGQLYTGTVFGVEVSSNQGATWTDPDPLLGGTHPTGYAITVDPNIKNKVFLTPLGSRILISTDGGSSWTPSTDGDTTRENRKLNVDPLNSNLVFSGSFYGGGLLKSEDGGNTWSTRRFGPPEVYVWFPVVDPVADNIVYAGTNGQGLYKSTDYGETWSFIASLPETAVQGVTIDPNNHERVFAATGHGIFLSKDEGVHWTNVLPFPSWATTFVGVGSSVVYAETKQAGVFKSYDAGLTWQAINNGITNFTLGRSAPVLVNPQNPDVLYVASEAGGGVFKSTNGGANWFSVNLGLGNLDVRGLAMDPVHPNVLYACGQDGVYKTTTGGE